MTTTASDQATATTSSPASAVDHGGTRTALVTNIFSGIGEGTARKLQVPGCTVHGAARRTDRLQALTADGIRPLSTNVTDDAFMSTGVSHVLEETGRIDVPANSVGHDFYGVIEDVPIDKIRRQFEVNVFGLGRLTQLITPHVRTQGSGTIVNISSMGGKLTTPLNGQYRATKYAVEALNNALRMELRPLGIDVVVVEPSGIRAEQASIAVDHPEVTAESSAYTDQIWAVAGTMRSESSSQHYPSPEVVVRIIRKIATAHHPRTYYVMGFMAKPLTTACRVLLDRAFDQLIGIAFGSRRRLETRPTRTSSTRGRRLGSACWYPFRI